MENYPNTLETQGQVYVYIYIGPLAKYVKCSPMADSKMVLDAALLNTQHYKVYTKGKVE